MNEQTFQFPTFTKSELLLKICQTLEGFAADEKDENLSTLLSCASRIIYSYRNFTNPLLKV